MLEFSQEYLKPAMLMSLLTVWVLVGLFAYLNRYTRRQYFTIWTAAWLFYALWLTLGISGSDMGESTWLTLTKQWCIGASAIFLLWGGLRFLEMKTPQRIFALFMCFIFVWSYVGADHLENALLVSGPIFGLLGLSSALNAGCFFRLRHRRRYVGASLLASGFLLWGAYLAAFPFFPLMGSWEPAGFFSAAVLQLFIAVSMIILVLEEARDASEQAVRQAQSHKSEADSLRTQVVSTEERYRSLFDQASEGILIASAGDMRILELNQTARRLLGIEPGDTSEHRLTDFFDSGENTPGRGAPKEPCDTIPERHARVTFSRRDGSTVPVEIDGAPIEFEGQPAYQFFIRELTERTRLEQQLRQAEKLSALGQMISGIAHELNNPLAVIKGYLELILARHELPPHTRADLQKVACEGNRAAKLVNNFLAFSREQPMRRQTVNLNAIIERVIELRQFDVRIAGAEVIAHLDPNLPDTSADPDQVQQLLVNLLNNALHAVIEIGRPGKITLSTRTVNRHLQILVEDNGPGIPESVQPRIFEPFFTTKDVGAGTGLGLSIAHSIMTDHHGRIFYQPSSIGGAGFVLEFPIVAPDAGIPDVEAATASDNAGLEASSPSGARILVLDDERSLAELLGEMLELLGCRPTICNAPCQALELIASNDYDLILSDYRMPGMDGQQFFKAAIEKNPGLARRIIFLTGDMVNPETREFLTSTGTPHLSKPFQLDRVEAVIAKMLNDLACAA